MASAASGPAAPLVELGTQIDAASAFGSFFATGMASGVAIDMGRQARGQAFSDLVTMKDANGRTIDPRIAAQAANGIGNVSTIVMGAMSALGPTMQGVAKASIQKAVASVVLDGSLKQSLLSMMARAGAASGEMSAANVIQEGSNLILERAAKNVSNRVDGTTFTQTQADEVIQRLKDAAVSGAVQGAIFHAPEMLNEGLGIMRSQNWREVAKAAGVKESDMTPEVPPAPALPEIRPPEKVPTIQELLDSPEARIPDTQFIPTEARTTNAWRVKQMRKWVTDLKGVDTSTMHPDIKGPVQDILDQFNLSKPSKKTMAAAQEIKAKIDENPEASLDDWEQHLIDRASRKNFRELSFDEAKAVHDSVMYYDKLQKESTKLMIDGRKVDRAATVAEAVKQMPAEPKVKEETFRASPNLWDRVKKGKRWAQNALGDHMMGLDFLADTVAGGEDRAFYKGVFRQVHAGDRPDAESNGGERGALRYRQGIDDAQRQERSLLLGQVKNIDRWRAQKVQVGKWNLTHGERVSMYMLWQQEDSRAKLVDPKGGYGSASMPDPNHVYHPTMDDWYELMASITPEEQEAARSLGSGFKRIGEDVNKQHVAVKNYEMQLVENYFPEDVMPVSRGSAQELESARDLAKRKYTVGLPKGRTISRQGVVKPLNVRDAFDVFASHRDWASNYIHTDQPVINAYRILRDTQADITARWGPELYKELEDRIRKVQGNSENDTKLGRIMMRLRGSYVSSVLNLNPVSIAANLMNVERAVTSGLVKSGHALNGLMDSLIHPFAVHKELKTWSPEYRAYHAEGGFSKDMKEALAGGRNTFVGRAGKMMRRVVAYPARLTDRIAVRGIMRGAFFQAMDEMKSGSLSPEVATAMGISDAVVKELSLAQKMDYGYRYSEYVLEHVNSVPMATLMSGLHQGNWMEQMVGTFGSDAVRAQQLYKTAIRNAARDKTPKSYRRLAALTVGMFLLEPLHYVLINYARQKTMSARQPPSADDFKAAFDMSDDSEGAKSARKYIAYEFLDQASYYFPLIRDAVRPVVAASTGQYSGNSLLITDEYTRLTGKAMTAAAKLARGEGDESTWTTLLDNGGHLLASLLGIPYTSPKFWIKKAEQIAGGED